MPPEVPDQPLFTRSQPICTALLFTCGIINRRTLWLICRNGRGALGGINTVSFHNSPVCSGGDSSSWLISGDTCHCTG